MAQIGRPGLSTSEKAELWKRWKEGQTLSEIGRALGKHTGSIHGVLSLNGGGFLETRRRSRLALTLLEREEISRGIAAGQSIRHMARILGRSPSTVSREIRRHGGTKKYRTTVADSVAWDRARRPKLCRLATNDKLQRIVAEKLSLDWVPEQVAGWLKVQYPNDAEMRVSHETIYRSLFIQARGVLKKELIGHLRSKRTMRRSKHSRTKGQGRGQIIDVSPSGNARLKLKIVPFPATGRVI
jgi:transposase, IS30 family